MIRNDFDKFVAMLVLALAIIALAFAVLGCQAALPVASPSPRQESQIDAGGDVETTQQSDQQLVKLESSLAALEDIVLNLPQASDQQSASGRDTKAEQQTGWINVSTHNGTGTLVAIFACILAVLGYKWWRTAKAAKALVKGIEAGNDPTTKQKVAHISRLHGVGDVVHRMAASMQPRRK